jgi:hypothetical protein
MTEIKHIGRDELQTLLAGMDIDCAVDSKGTLYCVFPADDDFDHDVVFYFTPDDDGWFGIEAVADGFDLSEDEIGHALVFCNDFSRRARLPKAFIANGRLKLDQWTVFPEATDDEYISQYIELVLTMCWSFFVNAKQKLNN